jgi:hypothetical protein
MFELFYVVQQSSNTVSEMTITWGLFAEALKAAGHPSAAAEAIAAIEAKSPGSKAGMDFLVSNLPKAAHYRRNALITIMRAIVRSFGSAYKADSSNTPARQLCLGKAVLKFSQLGFVADTVADKVLHEVATMFSSTETGVRIENVRNVGIKFDKLKDQLESLVKM